MMMNCCVYNCDEHFSVDMGSWLELLRQSHKCGWKSTGKNKKRGTQHICPTHANKFSCYEIGRNFTSFCGELYIPKNIPKTTHEEIYA